LPLRVARAGRLLRAWQGTLERDVTKLLWRRKPRWIVISQRHPGSHVKRRAAGDMPVASTRTPDRPGKPRWIVIPEMDRHAGKHEARPARHPPMLGIRPRAAKARNRLTPTCVRRATSRC
jgi:hypothetical protein